MARGANKFALVTSALALEMNASKSAFKLQAHTQLATSDFPVSNTHKLNYVLAAILKPGRSLEEVLLLDRAVTRDVMNHVPTGSGVQLAMAYN